MAFKKGNSEASKANHAHAGRKPSAATVLKRRLIENKVDEAEASFAFLVAVRDNKTESSAIRLQAAGMILDRVLGKPTQMIGGDPEKPIVLKAYIGVSPDDWDNSNPST